MESEEKWWKKAKGLAKNKKNLIFLAIILLFVLITLFFLNRIQEKPEFYPVTNNVKIKPILKLFSQKQYMNLTSYVDNILSSLSGEEKKLALFYKAESYFLQQRYAEASEIYNQITQEFPKFWQANFRVGCIYLFNKNFSEAEKYLSRVNADLEEIHFWKGQFFYQQGKKEEALPFFKKSLSYPEAIFYTAEILKEKANGLESLSYFLILFEKYPDYRQKALASMIEIYEKNKDYVQLLKYLEIYEKLSPTDMAVKKKKGFALYLIGKKEEAYKILSPLASIKKDIDILKLLAEITYDMKKYNESIAFFERFPMNREDKKKYIDLLMLVRDFNKASNFLERFKSEEKIETASEMTQIYQKLTECYLQLDKLDQAAASAVYLTSLEETAENYLILAKIYKQLENTPAYLAALQKATEKEPKYLDLLLSNLIELGAPDQADIVIENILKKQPYEETALFYKGKLEYVKKKNDRAKATLFMLISLNVKDKKLKEEGAFILGTILTREEQFDEAERIFKEGLKSNPDSDKLNLKMAALLVRKKDTSGARKILETLKSKSLPAPLLAVVYELLASAEEHAGNFDKSAYYKKRAIELSQIK